MDNELNLTYIYDELVSRGYNVSLHDVEKLNDTHHDAISIIPEHGGIAPTIYEETVIEMVASGMSAQEIADEVIRVTEQHGNDLPDIQSQLMDKDYLLDSAQLCVCSWLWNKEFLDSTPNTAIPDTDLYSYVRFRVGDFGTVVPTHAHLESAGITKDELFAAAAQNSSKDYTVRSMAEVMHEMTGIDAGEFSPRMAVLSNRDAKYGASVITDKASLDKACQMLGTDQVYILPSSVHEVLAIPASSDISSEELSSMIHEINEAQVAENERLSELPYLYDGDYLALAAYAEMERSKSR